MSLDVQGNCKNWSGTRMKNEGATNLVKTIFIEFYKFCKVPRNKCCKSRTVFIPFICCALEVLLQCSWVFVHLFI